MWLWELKEEWSAAQNILAASKWVEKNASSTWVSTEVNGSENTLPSEPVQSFPCGFSSDFVCFLMYFLLTSLLLKLGKNVLEKSVQSVKIYHFTKVIAFELIKKEPMWSQQWPLKRLSSVGFSCVRSTFAALIGIPNWLFMSCQEQWRGNLIWLGSALEFILNARLFEGFPQSNTVQAQSNGYPELTGLMTFWSLWISYLWLALLLPGRSIGTTLRD